LVGFSLALLLGQAASARAAKPVTLTIPATSFTGSWDGASVFNSPTDPQGLECIGSCTLFAPFTLPQGATLEGLELEGCTTDLFSVVEARLYACNDQGCSEIAVANSALANLDGCGRVASAGFQLTIDNDKTRYVVRVGLNHQFQVPSVKAVRLTFLPK